MFKETLGHGSDGKEAAPNYNLNSESLSASLLEKLKEKHEPSLGERNPLITTPRLDNPEAISALKLVTERTIKDKGGLCPEYMESDIVWDQETGKEYSRLIIRFETKSLTEQQLEMLEQVVKITYGQSSHTRHDSQGRAIQPAGYPVPDRVSKTSPKNKITGSLLGWYMGRYTLPISGGDIGLFIYKNLGDSGMAQYFRGKSSKEWFTNEDLSDPYGKKLNMKYLIEIREEESYQTDIVKMAIQVGNILGKKEILNDSELLYEVYNKLNRLGLKSADKNNIYGLDEQIEKIERVLFEPLANLHLSHGIDLFPGSVLLVGVPGTGKTLMAEYFLQKDTGVFLVPIDPLDLARDLAEKKDEKKILPRISQVFKETKRPIVLQLDDIDMLAQDEQAINSALLNLMAGVRASGFYVLASTNHPEKINPQLLQPERFAHLIYYALPTDSARRGILEVHANRVSRELKKGLFKDEEERDAILGVIANRTKGFTSRYLADICTEAKTFYLHRLAKKLEKSNGLTEHDIMDTFSTDDWAKGFEEAKNRYNEKEILEWDKKIKEFVDNYSRKTGFVPQGDELISLDLKKEIEAAIFTSKNNNQT